MPLKHRSSIFPSEIAHLSAQRADVLVTHEAPSGPGLHRHGFSQIAALARAMQVKAAFHGHQHEDVRYADGVWHGVGEQGIVTITRQMVIPGKSQT